MTLFPTLLPEVVEEEVAIVVGLLEFVDEFLNAVAASDNGSVLGDELEQTGAAVLDGERLWSCFEDLSQPPGDSRCSPGFFKIFKLVGTYGTRA